MLTLVLLAVLAQTGERRFAADGEIYVRNKPLTEGQILEVEAKYKPLATWIERTKSEKSAVGRQNAVNTLAAISGGPRVVHEEAQRCQDAALPCLADDAAEMRLLALRVLDKAGDQKCLKKVLPLLKDKDQAVRVATIKLLGKLGDRSCIKPLAVNVATDGFAGGDAIEAIKQIGGPEAAKALEALAKRTKDTERREKLLAAADWINSRPKPEESE